eukprot:5639924-Prymnesium_polylepis.1
MVSGGGWAAPGWPTERAGSSSLRCAGVQRAGRGGMEWRGEAWRVGEGRAGSSSLRCAGVERVGRGGMEWRGEAWSVSGACGGRVVLVRRRVGGARLSLGQVEGGRTDAVKGSAAPKVSLVPLHHLGQHDDDARTIGEKLHLP